MVTVFFQLIYLPFMKLKQHQKYLQELLDSEHSHSDQLHEIVEAAIREHSLLTESLSKQHESEKMSFGDRIATKVARFVGSWAFVISFIVIFGSWIFLNTAETFLHIHFDPYPYDVIKLTLSCISAIQAPLIMMSQNRQARKARQRSDNQYLINLKAEIDLRNLHQKMDLLMKQQIKNLLEVQKIQLDLMEKMYVKMDKLKDFNSNQNKQAA